MHVFLLFRYSFKIVDRLYMYLCKSAFYKCGDNVIFHPINSFFNYNKISIGNNVSIGNKAHFECTRSHIYISDNVMFAPNVTIRGGNHSSHIIGKLLINYKDKDKLAEDDLPVYIEEDVWVGTNVTILKGVRIRRGSIVAAGAVVTKSFPPYSVIGGVPAKVIKYRWTIDEILEHEKLLYLENDKYKKEQLEQLMK